MKKYLLLIVCVLNIIMFADGMFGQTDINEMQAIEQLKNRGVRIRIERGPLKMLSLDFNSKTKVNDEDLKILSILYDKIKECYIYDYRSSTKILEHVKEMKNLEELSVGIRIAENDMRYLSNLKQLKSLGLVKNNIRGDGFHYLKDLLNLSEIDLIGNPINDINLKYFENHLKIRTLNLNETPVSNKALDIIAKYKSRELVAVYVIGTKVTKKAAERFYKLRGVEACISANDCHLQ